MGRWITFAWPRASVLIHIHNTYTHAQAISLALEDGDATGALELLGAMVEHGAWPRRGLYAAVLQAAGRGAFVRLLASCVCVCVCVVVVVVGWICFWFCLPNHLNQSHRSINP